MKVTLANLDQVRKEIAEQERQMVVEDPLRPKVDDGSGTPVMRLNGSHHDDDEGNPPEGSGGGASAEEGAQHQEESQPPADDKATDWKQKFEDLDREHKILDRNFRNIQRQVTPVQQENARLRKDIEELRQQVGNIPDKQREARSAKLEALKDVMPEAAELFHSMEEEITELRGHVQKPTDEPELPSPNALSRIWAAHPDLNAESLSRDLGFWAYVDALPGGSYAREVLRDPEAYFEGAEYTIELIQGYKDAKAPRPPATPSVERPSNISPSTAKASIPPMPGAKPKTLSRDEIAAKSEELRKEVRRATPERLSAIRKELGELDRLLFASSGS